MCPVSYVDVIPDYPTYADLSATTYTHDQSSLYGQIFGSGFTCENSVDFCYEKLTFLMCPETCTGLADNDDLAYNEYASSDCHDTTSYDDDYLCIDRALEYDDLSDKCRLVLAYACPISFMDQIQSLGLGVSSDLLNSGSPLGPSDYLEDQNALVAMVNEEDGGMVCSDLDFMSYVDDTGYIDEYWFNVLACPVTAAAAWAGDDDDGDDLAEFVDDGEAEAIIAASDAVGECVLANCPEGFDTEYYSYSYLGDDDWFDGTCDSVEGALDFTFLCQSADATCGECQSAVRAYSELLWETQAASIGLVCDLDCPAYGAAAEDTHDDHDGHDHGAAMPEESDGAAKIGAVAASALAAAFALL